MLSVHEGEGVPCCTIRFVESQTNRMLLLRGRPFQDADITSTLKFPKVGLVEGDTRDMESVVRFCGIPV